MGTNQSTRYYIVRGSSDPSVLGNTTGIKQADIKKEGFRNPEEFDRILSDLGTNRYWEIRDLVPGSQYDVQCVELMGKSKCTDFLRFGPFLFNCPFMISEKVDRVIAKHKMSGVTTFPVQVRRKDRALLNYRLFYILPMPQAMIDFTRSTYYTGDVLTGREPLAFENEKSLSAALAEGKRVKVESIGLKPMFTDTDLFALHGGEIVVSEKLKVDLEENNATSGINLLPAFGEVPWPVVSVEH